jgi:hypothetical protein
MKLLNFLTLLLSISFSFTLQASEDWLCKKTASERDGKYLNVCGVGVGKTEGESRKKALERAKQEFKDICSLSDDCKDKKAIVTPLRNSCLKLKKGGYKCFRGLRFEIEDLSGTFRERRSIPSSISFGLNFSSALFKTLSPYFDSHMTKGFSIEFEPSREELNGWNFSFGLTHLFFSEDHINSVNQNIVEANGQYTELFLSIPYYSRYFFFGPEVGVGLHRLTSDAEQGSGASELTRSSLKYSSSGFRVAMSAGIKKPIDESSLGWYVKALVSYYLLTTKKTESSITRSNPDVKGTLTPGLSFGLQYFF